MLHGALSSGNFPVVWAPLKLVTAVLEPVLTTLTLQPSLQDKLQHIVVTHTIAPDVPAVLMGDTTRLRQMLLNLMSNACKFTSAGGAITVCVDVVDAAPPGFTSAAARWLRVRVVDTGIGIDPTKLERVFGAFVQEDDSTVRKYGGTGLGLAVRAPRWLRRVVSAGGC